MVRRGFEPVRLCAQQAEPRKTPTAIPVANTVPMNSAGGMRYLASDAKFLNDALVAGFVFALDVVEQLPA